LHDAKSDSIEDNGERNLDEVSSVAAILAACQAPEALSCPKEVWQLWYHGASLLEMAKYWANLGNTHALKISGTFLPSTFFH
jgi:hypothetical protein